MGNSLLPCQYGQISPWGVMAHVNWETIEDFPDLIAFADVKAMKQDRPQVRVKQRQQNP